MTVLQLTNVIVDYELTQLAVDKLVAEVHGIADLEKKRAEATGKEATDRTEPIDGTGAAVGIDGMDETESLPGSTLSKWTLTDEYGPSSSYSSSYGGGAIVG